MTGIVFFVSIDDSELRKAVPQTLASSIGSLVAQKNQQRQQIDTVGSG